MSDATSSPPVVVVGSLNVDHVVESARLPGPGETLLGGPYRRSFGGKGANQAVAAARAGATAWMVGRVGDDDAGVAYAAELERHGVRTTFLGRDAQVDTGCALIVVAAGGENSIVVAPGANDSLEPAHLAALDPLLASAAGVLVVSLEVPLATVVAAVERAHAHGWRVVLNPAPALRLPEGLLAAGDVLTPNEHEAELVHERGLAGLRMQPHALVVTRGGDGVELFEPGAGGPVRVAAPSVEVVDTTGAGDTFTGALAAGLAAGMSLEAAAREAVVAASHSTSWVGAQPAVT